MNAAEVCHRCKGQKTVERSAGPDTVRPAVVVCPRCKGSGEEPITPPHWKTGGKRWKTGGKRWPEPPPDEVARPILTEAASLGSRLRAIAYDTRSEEAAAIRSDLYYDVRRLARKAFDLHIRKGTFADALGMSRYGLDLILSGKKRVR